MSTLDFYKQHIMDIKLSTNGWYIGKCPLHDDNRASFSFETKYGNWRFLAGCGHGTLKQFCECMGISNPYKKIDGTHENKKIIANYNYTDKNGTPLFQTVRYEPKDFWQRRPDGNGGNIYNLQGVRLVPYNLPEVLKAETVFIAEGEKYCETLKAWGLIATTNPMGAGKWRTEFSRYFKDKAVLILPDNDEAGKKHAEQVANSVHGIAKSVKVVELPALEQKQDVTDWIAQGHTKDELLCLANKTLEWKPAKNSKAVFTLTKLSDLLDEPDEQTEWLVENVLPAGGFSLLAGKPKAGKSTLARNLAAQIAHGQRTAVHKLAGHDPV
jgi:hypothetical protein